MSDAALFPLKHFTTTKADGDMKIQENRRRFLISCQINPQTLVLAKQIHSNIVKIVSKSDGGYCIENCDGFITDDKNMRLGIFTADCMPILICSKNQKIKAAIHSGWKGLSAGIIENAVNIFDKTFNINPQDLCAYIGAHIQSCCYEVGSEFEKIFQTPLIDGKLNLSKIAQGKMQKLGIQTIEISPYCAMHDKDLFFSYRRDKSAERMLTII
ncbi:MAG: peptidoglycan editing factor PgeF [Elusimicrobiota bacterium]|jgi:YfiH family protein|nr:peptidoglycan editing factor PgeF [Elusimicrobiota bacterium]